MSSKRKHNTLALKHKMNILKKLDNGESICKLAKEYGVGRATIYDLKKKKQKILDHMKRMESGLGKRKTLRVGNYPKMENALYLWFKNERSKHIAVSGEILKAKAIEFYKKNSKKDNFRASDGWLDKFKKRYGIRLYTKPREKLSSEESALQPYIQHFKEENLVQIEILEPQTTATVKVEPDTALNCFNTCITWAEENGISATDIIILRNMRDKVLKQDIHVAQKQI